LGQFAKTWDGVILLAMLYTAVVTPFEIAFFVRGEPPAGPNGVTLTRAPRVCRLAKFARSKLGGKYGAILRGLGD
jgi:hypothetical protein